MKKYKIVLLGYYGFGNLGDELLLKSCIEFLISSGIDRKKIIVLSNDPDNTQKIFNIDSVSRWKFHKVINIFKQSEALILGGGGLFQDSSSVKSCLWYWFIMWLAKYYGLKIFALGQSIGPLKTSAGKYLTQRAFNLCDLVHVRDDLSFEIAKSFKLNSRVILGSDLVMMLKPEILNNKRDKFLLNLRPCKNINDFINLIVPDINNFENITGVALSNDDEKILKKSANKINFDEIIRVKNFKDACSLWNSAYSGIGMRLHFGILSRMFKIPVAMIPYDPKVSEFARISRIPIITEKFREPVQPLNIPSGINNYLKSFMIKFANGQASN